MVNDSNELLKQLEEAFAAMKKELGFSATLDELDDVFFIRDFIMKERFVSNRLSRMLSARISETYMSWAGYLQSIMVPNPSSIVNVSEHNVFDEAEREGFLALINKIMAFVSTNTLNGLTKDKTAQASFIDASLSLWKELKPALQEMMGRINHAWKLNAQQKPQN